MRHHRGLCIKKPVLACGLDNTFIKNNVTGILIDDYNEEIIIKILLTLEKNHLEKF